jgi:hypothetical protein
MRAYGDILLNALDIGGVYKNSLSSITLNENKKILGERLDMIEKYKKKSRLAAAIGLIATMLLGAGASVAGAYAMPVANESTSITPLTGQIPVFENAEETNSKEATANEMNLRIIANGG